MNGFRSFLVAGAFGAVAAGAPHPALAIVDINPLPVCQQDDAEAGSGEFVPGEPRGTSPECPLMPAFILDTAFWFTFTVDDWIERWGEDSIVWFDPPAVISYTYEAIGADFLSIELPPFGVVPNPNDYTVTVGASSVDVAPEGSLDFLAVFGFRPSLFTVSGISAALGLDPEDTLAFPIGLALGNFGGTEFSVTITPSAGTTAVIPLPAAGVLYLGALGLLGAGIVRRRRRAA